MGCLKFNKSTPTQSQIIYTDNVRRQSSFSLTVTDKENGEVNFKDVSKHIETFEETADNKQGLRNYIIGENGDFIVVADLGANFIFQERTDEEVEEKTARVSTLHKCLVFASAFFVLTMDMGLVFSFGTLFPAILEKFGDNRASTAAIQSVFTGIGPSSAIVTGAIGQRFGPRKCGIVGGIMFSSGLLVSYFATSTVYLQLSYGVLAALGFSVLYISSNQVISQIFTGHTRIICLSILAMGPGIGGSIYPSLLKWLTDSFGLNGTFLLVGGIVTNTVPLTTLWSTSAVQNKIEHDTNQENSAGNMKQNKRGKGFLRDILQTVKYKPFLFLFLGLGLSVSTVNTFGILVMDILASNGLSVDNGITALTVSNAASIPARLIPGFSNRIKRYNTLMTPMLATLFGACGMLLLIFDPTYTGSILASAIVGVCRGCCIGSMSVGTIKLLDVTRFSTGLGLILGMIGLITTAMGPVYGFLRDLSGSYTIPLYTMAMVFLAGCLLCSASMILYSRINAQRKREASMSVFTVTRF